jgi:uncharacterized protein YacL (UPF0231 family)
MFSLCSRTIVCDTDLHVCHRFSVGHIVVLLWFISIIMHKSVTIDHIYLSSVSACLSCDPEFV